MDHYFGGGERVQPPSKRGTPAQSILLRRNAKTPERATATDNTVESQLTPERVDNAGKGEVTNAGNTGKPGHTIACINNTPIIVMGVIIALLIIIFIIFIRCKRSELIENVSVKKVFVVVYT